MADKKNRIICVGEVMVELSRGADGRYGFAFGGDTFNTAVYLARAGIPAAYATAMGDDPYSDGLMALAAAEGVNGDLIARVTGRMPGLYLIETDAKGERQVLLLARDLAGAGAVRAGELGPVCEALLSARLVYFSGVTLSLYSNTGLGRFLASLELARKQGVIVAFDGNFRPRGWKGDVARARTVFTEALKRVDIALPTFEDEAMLWGDTNPEATVERLQAYGIGEIVVKNGPSGALVADKNGREHVPVPEVVQPVDTTAAGDSFNAAYLAARLNGEAPIAAAAAAHGLAGQVIRHRGAIMPRAAAAMH